MKLQTKIQALRFSFLNIQIIFCLGFTVVSSPEELLTNLAKFTETFPQEKVHIHSDKPYYATGEDIWLKGYVVVAERNEPSLLSSVLYLDLADDKNTILKHIALPVVNGMAHGNIFLPDSLTAGKYRLRAYTNYMRNYDEGFFFEKFIEIGSMVNHTAAKQRDAKAKDFTLQFFPEGGALVNGLRSKVGIKAVSEDGSGRNLSGYVRGRAGEKVALFSTEHAGMGVFALLPKKDEKYTAVVTLEDGSEKTFSLPDALASGFVLSVNTTGDNISAKVSCTPNLIKGQGMYVIAQANGKAYASFTAKVDKAAMTTSISKKLFPTGIVHITLFTSENKPLAERLIFVNHNDFMSIDVQTRSPNAGIKQKASLAFTVKDNEGNPVDGNFSVSVTDAGAVAYDEAEETTILSSLLLTSDLKGYIEQPNYYFTEANDNKTKQLDNLLLTQGWRRFTWTDIAAGKNPEPVFRLEQAYEITGKTLTLGNKPLPGARVTLISSTPGIPLLLDTISDAKGNFVFDRLDIPDSATFIIQAKGNKDNKNIIVKIDGQQEITGRGLKVQSKSIDINSYVQQANNYAAELDKFNPQGKGIGIKAVEIVSKPAFKEHVKGSANPTKFADVVIPGENVRKLLYISAALIDIPGMKVDGKYKVGHRHGVSFFINGMQAAMEDALSYPTEEVEGIEWLSSGLGGGGQIYITLRKGPRPSAPQTNVVYIKNKGYSIIKSFYSPDYDDPKTNKDILDRRTTIFWSPNLLTDKEGKGSLSYFNAGIAGTYRVTVEGMDVLGNVGRKVITYTVQ